MKQNRDTIDLYFRIGKTVYSADKIWELSMLIPKDDIVKKHMENQDLGLKNIKGYKPIPIEVEMPPNVYKAMIEGINEKYPKFGKRESIDLTTANSEFVVVKYTPKEAGGK